MDKEAKTIIKSTSTKTITTYKFDTFEELYDMDKEEYFHPHYEIRHYTAQVIASVLDKCWIEQIVYYAGMPFLVGRPDFEQASIIAIEKALFDAELKLDDDIERMTAPIASTDNGVSGIDISRPVDNVQTITVRSFEG